jgi:hypothetical protein
LEKECAQVHEVRSKKVHEKDAQTRFLFLFFILFFTTFSKIPRFIILYDLGNVYAWSTVTYFPRFRNGPRYISTIQISSPRRFFHDLGFHVHVEVFHDSGHPFTVEHVISQFLNTISSEFRSFHGKFSPRFKRHPESWKTGIVD